MTAPAPEPGLAAPAGLACAGPGFAGCPAAPAGFAMRTAGFAPAAPSSFAALRPRAAASPAATAAGKPAVVAAAARPVPAGGGPVPPASPALLRSPSGADWAKRNCGPFRTGSSRDPAPGQRALPDRAPHLRRLRLRGRMPPEYRGIRLPHGEGVARISVPAATRPATRAHATFPSP